MKERLTGAIILVALIVLLAPALLTGPLRPAARSAAPPAEVSPLRTYTIDLADNARAGETAVRSPAPAQPVPLPQAAPPPAPAQSAPLGAAASPSSGPAAGPAAGAHAPATRAPAATAKPAAPAAHAGIKTPPAGARPAAPSPAPVAGAAAPGAGWMVQLGSFAQRAHAERLAQRLRARGFQVGVSRATTGRRLYRVRAGPVSDRAAAEQLAAKLRAAGQRGAMVEK